MPKEQRSSLISIVVISAVFGLFAGAVGTMVVFVKFEPYAGFLTATPATPIERALPPVSALDQPLNAVENAARSAAVFYPPKVAGKFGSVYAPSEALGGGYVLTSDGWIMTAGAFATKPNAAIVVIGGKSHAITAVSRDPYSGISFVKVDAANLPVTSFAKDADVASGDPVFTFDALRGARRADVIGPADLPSSDNKNPVLSSERLQKAVRVSSFGNILVGSALVDRQGDLIGIIVQGDGQTAYVVPVSAFAARFSDMLRDKRVTRPVLGLHYVDLSAMIGAPQGDRGALVADGVDGRSAGVMPRSPAQAAGLRNGDIVLSVDSQEVTARTALADLVADYAPGSKISLAVKRGTETLKLEATLEQSAP